MPDLVSAIVKEKGKETMTDTLKTFVAGEKIKSSDTNSNNQYIISLIQSIGSDLQTYLEQQISQLSGNFFKAGYILGLPFSTVPTGFLKCDGSSLLREDYQDLFDVIGTTYGAADDYHFNLPNYEGVFLRGTGGNAATLGTKQLSGVPNITGSVASGAMCYGSNNPTTSGAFTAGTSNNLNFEGGNVHHARTLNFDANKSSSVYKNGLTEVRPDNMSVMWVIKY